MCWGLNCGLKYVERSRSGMCDVQLCEALAPSVELWVGEGNAKGHAR